MDNSSADIRPQLFNDIHALFGDTVVSAASYLTIGMHLSESAITAAICWHRQYSLWTSARWTLQSLAVGGFSMRYLFWPRPAIGPRY
jgi:hypothetical protein